MKLALRLLLIPAAILAVAALGLTAAEMTSAQDEPPEPEWETVAVPGGPAFDLTVGPKPDADMQVVYAAGNEPLSSTHAVTWTLIPGTGRLVNVAAATDGTVYAADVEGQGYQSRNYGGRWRKISVRGDAPVWFEAVSPDYDYDEAAYSIIVDEWRLYRTTNDAQSWHEVKLEADVEDQVGAVAFSPLHRSDETTFVGSHRGLFKWTQDERTWTHISGPDSGIPAFGEEGGPVSSQGIVIPYEYGDDPDRHWDPVLTTLFAYNASGVHRSDDDGATWRQLSLPAAVEQVNGFVVSNAWPKDPVLMVAVASADAVALVSMDDGGSWSKVPAKDGLIGTDVAMALDFAPIPRPDEHHRSTVNFPLVLKNSLIEPPGEIYNGSREAYVSTDGAGVLYTDDGGETWHPTSPSFSAVTVTAMDVMPGGPDAPAIAGSSTAGLFMSPDAGLTWEWIDSGVPRGLGQAIIDVIVSPEYESDRTIYAIAQGGVWASTDAGRNWARTSAPEGSVALAFSPDFASDRTMVTTGHISTDAGSSWDPLTPVTGTWKAVAFSAGYPTDNTIWAGTPDVSSDYRYGLYRSSDGGQSWTIIDDTTLSRASINHLYTAKYDPGEDPRIFAATSRGLVVSYDDGLDWTRESYSSYDMVDVTGRALVEPFTTGIVLTAGRSGAEYSLNRGSDFEREPRSSKPTFGAGLTDDGRVMLVGLSTAIERLDRSPGEAD